jgi:hypothetical protein
MSNQRTFCFPDKYFLSGGLGGGAKPLKGDAKRNSVVKCIGFGCPLPKLLIRCAQSSCGEATWLVSLM